MNNYAMTTTAPTITMSSREIAELTGKEHFNVMRDIRSLVDDLEITHLRFEGRYKDSTGRTLPMFNLPYRETTILLTGYSVPMRAKVVDRWTELEAAQVAKPAFQLPQTMGQALALAAQQWEQIEAQALQIAVSAPKVAP